jgi:hypothetical protein
MERFHSFFTGIVALVLATITQSSAEPAVVHSWRRINYPSFGDPRLGGHGPSVLISCGQSGFQFTILSDGESLPAVIADASQISARLHLPDGTVVPPHPDQGLGWVGVSGAGTSWSRIFKFPWQRNAMDEGWVELDLAGRTYWVELPYGFTRNPADALPSDAALDEPRFPPAMKELGKEDRLVPWLNVYYDLGKIQNGWRLSMTLANPFDASAELTLYRDDRKVGGSLFLWELHSPQTAVAITYNDRKQVFGHGRGIRLDEGGLQRSDTFSFNRFSSRGRGWGEASISVDDHSYQYVVPSSLFKYIHGVTDPQNDHRLPR